MMRTCAATGIEIADSNAVSNSLRQMAAFMVPPGCSGRVTRGSALGCGLGLSALVCGLSARGQKTRTIDWGRETRHLTENPLARHYSRFRVGERLLLTGHS